MTDIPNARYIEAPEQYRPAAGDRSVFLAGGITGCPDWQAEAREMIHDRMPEAVVLNPRRTDFDPTEPDAESKQVQWEHHHLHAADVVLFWYPASATDQPIAMYELGAALHRGATVTIGADRQWRRYTNLVTQVQCAAWYQTIEDELASLVRSTVALLRHPGKLSHAARIRLAAARSTAFAAIAREARAHRDSPPDANTYGPRPATNDPADIAVHIARNFEFELSPEEVHDHVTKVLLADQARERLRNDSVLTEGRWFPLYHDQRDAKTALPPVLQVHDAEAAKRLRQAGFTVERTRATSTWIITDGPR